MNKQIFQNFATINAAIISNGALLAALLLLQLIIDPGGAWRW